MSTGRRDFLKLIGLGGVALCLPKPAEIVLAKMSDLRETPVHALYGKMGPVDAISFGLQMIWIDTDIGRPPSIKEYTDFLRNASLSARILQENGHRVELLRMGLQWLPESVVAINLIDSLQAFYLSKGESLEFWVTRKDGGRVVPIMVRCSGIADVGAPYGRQVTVYKRLVVQMPLNAITLDRVQAIKMGLALPSEPEFPL